MDIESGAAPMPSSEGHIVAAEGGAGNASAPLTINSLSPLHTGTTTPSQPPANDSMGADSANTPSFGRKRRLSFKDKQRQGVSHVGSSGTTFKSTLAGDSSSGPFQSPTSTATSSSPHQLFLSPTGSQTSQPARKKTAADAAAETTTTVTTGCVFTALEPTRGGPRGAARPLHRHLASPTARLPTSTTLFGSSATSTEPSPVTKSRSSPSEQASASPGVMHSPLPASTALPASDSAFNLTSSSASPLTVASPGLDSTAAEGRDIFSHELVGISAASPAAAGGGGGRPSTRVLSRFSTSLENIVSAPSVSSPTVSSSSSAVASPKLSFKDRQRAAAATGISRNASKRGSFSSPVIQVASMTTEASSSPKAASLGASSSFLAVSHNSGTAATEASVPHVRAQTRTSPLPATAAITSPTQKVPCYANANAEAGLTRSGGGSKSKEGNSPMQSIPRLPIERLQARLSPLQSYTAVPPPAQREGVGKTEANRGTPSHNASVVTAPPLALPNAPTGPAEPSYFTAGPSPSETRCTQSAPPALTEPRSSAAAAAAMSRPPPPSPPPSTSLRVSSSSQDVADIAYSTHPTVTTTTNATTTAGEGHSQSSQTRTNSSQADEDDEENAALAFTQNATRLHLYDPDEPSPQEFAMALPHEGGISEGGSGGGGGTRSGTMDEISSNSATWRANSRRSSGAGRELERNPLQAGEDSYSGDRHSHSSGGGDRHAYAARRARTSSLDTPPPSTYTVPPSPSPGIPSSSSPCSFSPRKMPTSEQTKLTGHGGRVRHTVIGHWKQQNKSQQKQQQQQSQPLALSHTASSSMASLNDTAELSTSRGDAPLARTSRSRPRRHRDKMLAPDGAVLNTPRTGRGPGGESGGRGFGNVRTPRMHGRSHTVDDFALYAVTAGRREAQTPSSLTPGSVAVTHNPTPETLVPPFGGHPVVAVTPSGGGVGEHAGLLDTSVALARPPLPLWSSMTDTVTTTAASGVGTGGRGSSSTGRAVHQPGSPRSRGAASFPRLPLPRDHANSANSAMPQASFALAAVLSPSGASAENFSGATPATVATPNGYRSGDERSSNAASSGNRTETYVYGTIEEPSHTTTTATMPDDLDNEDRDYLLQTYNTYYAGETSLSATTAELRKSRRRSNYSSLHYGTMTGYRRRGDSHRPRSDSTAQKDWRRRRGNERLTSTEGRENEEKADLTAAAKVMDRGTHEERSNTVARQGVHSSEHDDEESICEQKGSEEDRDKEAAADNEEGIAKPHLATSPSHHRAATATAAAGGGGAPLTLVDDEEDGAEDGQRRAIGIWETIEHVFLPRYELAEEAASKESLTGPASPSSPNLSDTASIEKPCAKPGGSPPTVANVKSTSSSPKTLSSHGLQPTPTVLLSSSPAQPKFSSPTNATPSAVPPALSAGNSPPTGPRPSGLVVLPDAVNLADDTSMSVSLTFSQFRKAPGQVAGTKRLEPEKFSFGTAAATYNVEPTDEQQLPEGSADVKVAARLVFDAAAGVTLMDPEDEVGRYEPHGHSSLDARSQLPSPKNRNEEAEGGGEDEEEEGDDGACQCDASFIAKDFKGLDCSRYDASDLYDHCSRCHRRPAAFLCLHCMEAVCPSHVQRHHLLNPTQCTLFLNLLDIMSSFDRIFWCEKCKQFTWKHTEIYDSLVDQIAYTRGTYLKFPARDIHCVGYEVRLRDADAQAAAVASIKARSVPSVSEDAASSNCGSPARLRRAVSGSSLNAALLSLAPNPALATFPTIGTTVAAATSPQMRSSTPPVHIQSPTGSRPAAQPSMLGVNNLIIFGASPSSPVGISGAVSRLHGNAVETPPLRSMRSPMQKFLNRDPLETSGSRAVTVGEPVTKLCALGASVQGWRTTQEDAEAAFLIDIPALSSEVVDRKELRAVAAAAAAKKKEKEQQEQQQQPQQSDVQDDRPADAEKRRKRDVDAEDMRRGSQWTDKTMPRSPREGRHAASDLESSASAQLPVLDSTLRTSDRAEVKAAQTRANEESDTEKYRARAVANDKEKGHNIGDEENSETTTAAAEEEEQETIPMAVFCVFDGHGGDAVAKLAARHFETHLRRAIHGTRADDVRARALLFYLSAESNVAALLGPQPAVTAIPGVDGSITFLPPAKAATQRGAGCAASSPPPCFPSLPNPTTSSHSRPTVTSSSSHSRLLIPGNSLTRPFDAAEGVEAEPVPLVVPLPSGEEDSGMPQVLQLPEAVFAESIPIVMPVTAESLRLHVTGSVVNFPASGAGEVRADNGPKAPPSNAGQDSASVNAHGLARNRRSKTTLDAWADMEDPQPDMAASVATAAAAAAAVASASPLNQRLLPPSFASICSPDFRHFSIPTNNPQAVMAASTAFCASPSAWVSIPEMEMLRQYFASIMEDALLSLDDYLRTTPEGVRGDYDCVGCTACVVGITANFVLCANVGDSGAAFYTKDRIKVISVKHRVSDEAEQKRINAAGYAIVNDRIEGMSAVPRALGDFDFKQCGGRGPHEQAVTAVPDVTIMPTPSDTDQWGIILACDGVWDTATLHQVHVALTNTVNDLDVASSATEAVLRGAELYRHHLRGPGAPRGDSPSTSPQRSSPSHEDGGPNSRKKNSSNTNDNAAGRSREGSTSPSPAKRRALLTADNDEGSVIGEYECEEGGGVARRLPQVDPILLTAAAGVFAQCVAPADNDEGVGLDNCSLILVERRNVQE
ncbi:hypothetical protein ABB37_05974 [Leptomonas pyrrhocoris]|uniref:PPM-type phosphatase domain-containing protein n=1 Tax=Leptomonas pyrrhocoris TaxID=157538 RepID=A0A0M9FYT4_LEPPY|nr:hypothetical protein ABB37_05974 [Leptomonas pyrrhocoris]KPA78910.1 hypothetical protein ABB37_05974 [Leptomonas pyrrhocoris]|eukprot:XP_015657349.1 hypothetical protein ABB37_05974 [Leptomonas pyrrhocoris]